MDFNKIDNNRTESGRTEQIIEKLVDMIENGQNVPLAAGKVMVNKEDAVLLLRELENIVQGEQKIYRETNDRRGKIINDAKKEAEDIIYEAEQEASRIRVSKRVSSVGTGYRADRMSEEDKEALRTASDIYAASLIYTDEMLTEVNDVVASAYEMINNQYGRMVQTLEEKAQLIAKNKAELMESLKELSKEERYVQILDLGQLLSHELYVEKMKVREAENVAPTQLEFYEEDSAFIDGAKPKTEEEIDLTKTINPFMEANPDQAVKNTLDMFKGFTNRKKENTDDSEQ